MPVARLAGEFERYSLNRKVLADVADNRRAHGVAGTLALSRRYHALPRRPPLFVGDTSGLPRGSLASVNPAESDIASDLNLRGFPAAEPLPCP
jgi:hypothetical protein